MLVGTNILINMGGGSGSGPPPAAKTWSPTQHQNTIILSNGLLTATGASGAGGFNAVGLAIITSVITAGQKLYCEITVDAVDVPDSSQPGFGVGNINTSIADAAFLGQDTNSIANYSGLIFSGSTVATIPGYGLGDTIGIAVIGGNGIWWTADQSGATWNAGGTANPATGVGGFNIAPMGDVYLAYNVKNTEQVTINFGATAFKYSVPAGFN